MDIFANAIRGTVNVGRLGLGVHVAGNYVLTAAHCLRYCIDLRSGQFARNDNIVEAVFFGDTKFLFRVVTVDPVLDIALLESIDEPPPDPSEFEGDSEEDYELRELVTDAQDFNTCSTRYASVPLSDRIYESGDEFVVHTVTHDRDLVEGNATATDCFLSVKHKSQIESGTSGAPIVNSDGGVVGIISMSGGGAQPYRALPAWAAKQLRRSAPCAARRTTIAELSACPSCGARVKMWQQIFGITRVSLARLGLKRR